jgi:diguanylate cyclase
MPAATAHVQADGPTLPGGAGTSPGGDMPFVNPSRPDTHARRAKIEAHYYRNLAVIAFSYTLDGLVMLLFWGVGTVDWKPALFYTAIGVALCAFWAGLRRTGWTLRFKDPDLTPWWSSSNMALQLTAMWLVPELNFMFALLLFICFISLTMRAQVKEAMVAWVVVSLLMGAVMVLSDSRLHIPDRNLTEQVVAWGFFALTVWRCIWMGTFNSKMTSKLKARSAELAELTRKVELLAHHDELTGLLNRRSLLTLIEQERQRSARHGTPLSVALIDLDKFKAINDRLGHQAGDETLKIFAREARSITRKTDRLGRYGGEEFLWVLVGAMTDEAQIPVERLRDTLKLADWRSVAPDFSPTFSCGIAAYREGESIEDLVKRADDALYRAKHEGRNCTRVG